MSTANIDPADNLRRMQAGELYYAFTPELVADRQRCKRACLRYNAAELADEANFTAPSHRRVLAELYNAIVDDPTPLPPRLPDPTADAAQFDDYPWIEAPVRMDYGRNVILGANVFVNFNATFIDTCTITIGARTLIGPNCSFYSGTHPLDPAVRNGTRGPELGKPIMVGEDCWFGGGCTVLPGVTIGRGVTVGAGSVVTKNVPDRVIVAGNPARVVRQLEALRAQVDKTETT